MSGSNPQDGNVGNLGDILKHAALVQMAKIFAERIPGTKYYLDSHSYLYRSRLVNPDWQQQSAALLRQSSDYTDYIELETPYVSEGEYLCSSGIVNKLLPDAHLLLCESNNSTRECLLQQLADNRVRYHTVKAQLAGWATDESFKKLPNLLLLIDPFQLSEPLWLAVNKCLTNMLLKDAPAMMLVFDYIKQPVKSWSPAATGWHGPIASLSEQPYHLAVYATADFVGPVQTRFAQRGWSTAEN